MKAPHKGLMMVGKSQIFYGNVAKEIKVKTGTSRIALTMSNQQRQMRGHGGLQGRGRV